MTTRPVPTDRSFRAPQAEVGSATAELDALFDGSGDALMRFDGQGRVTRTNAAMRALAGGTVEHIEQMTPAWQQLLGWPARLPAPGLHLTQEAWLADAQGHSRRWVAKVTGIGNGNPRIAVGWIARFEDQSVADERDLARVEIAALMGTAGVGVATYDGARGWVSASVGRQPAGGASGGGGGSPLSVGRDLVDRASLPDYERLQDALRKRERAEVRYAVQHRDVGRRWLLTRVEPAELGHDRPVCSVVTLDVTEEETSRVHREDLLRELRTILDVSPAGIAYLRGDTLVRCNGRFETMLGLAPGAAVGSTLPLLLTGAGVDDLVVAQAWSRAVEHGMGEIEVELAPRGTAGPRHWCSLALRRADAAGDGIADTVAVLTDISRLRSQEAELEGLERERELMFSLSDVGILYLRDGHIERANRAMAELSGYTVDELRGLPFSRLHEDDLNFLRHSAEDRRQLDRTGRSESERRLRRRDGGLLWAAFSQRPVDVRNPQAGTICSVVDVDERHRTRDLLQRQAETTKAVLDSVLVGIATLGPDGIEWMNRSARRMMAGELEDFVGQPIAMLATPDGTHPLRRDDWVDRLAEGDTEAFECRLQARDGRQFWVAGNAVGTGGAGTRQVTFAMMDIDSRRNAELQIAQARAGLQRMIETAPLAIALIDGRTHQVLQSNQMLSQFARRSMEEIAACDGLSWLPDAEAGPLTRDLTQALSHGETVRREWQRPAHGAAAASSWDVRIVSLHDGGDTGPGSAQLLLVATDVTEQREAEEARLQAAIAQREMLVREVHHRIKNNLQGVAGLLQQNAHRHPEASAALTEAVGQVHAIAQVHGLQVGSSGPLRVRNVVEAIAGSVQRMFGRTIRFEVEGAAPHRFALGEADSIPVALTVNELLTNAVKHGIDGSEIVCRLQVGDDTVSVQVRNVGALAAGFSLADVPPGISGLGLVRALLPRRGARLALDGHGAEVVAELALTPPAVALLAPL